MHECIVTIANQCNRMELL